MNKYIFTLACFSVFAIAFAFCGCSEDSDEAHQTNTYGTVCTKWGASTSEVMDYMKDYEMKTMENGFICYNGKNDIQTISYYFDNNSLKASLVLIPEENSSLEEVKSSFDKYVYIGEKNGTDIYISEDTNTMVTIGKKIKGEATYCAIGYIIINEKDNK